MNEMSSFLELQGAISEMGASDLMDI